MSGETTVGSIVGFLRLDDSDWQRKLSEAEASAKNLGRTSPNVHVTTNADEATAKLLGTAEAEKRVGDNAQKAGDNGSSGLVKILKATAPLLPAMVPLAAGVGALGVGFLGMGAAGVLVLKGIENEMKKATPEGQQFAAVVGTLKSNYLDLQTVSAKAAMPGLAAGLTAVNQQMPTFRLELSQAGSYLGGTMNAGLSGLSQLLVDLAPILDTVGGYVQSVATKFDSWAHSQGATAFIAYLQEQLPVAVQVLQNLGAAAGHLVTAFAPMGGSMLTVLSTVTRLLADLPVGVLQDLATAATSAYLAFEAWHGLQFTLQHAGDALGKVATEGGRLSSMSGALSSAGKGVGGLSLAMAGIGAVVGIATYAWSVHEQKVQANKQRYLELYDAVVKDNGAIGENTKQQLANQLATDSALQKSTDYGVSQKTLASAMQGNKSAISAVNTALEKNGQETKYTTNAQGMLVASGTKLSSTAQEIKDKVSAANKAHADGAVQAKKNAAATQLLADKQSAASQAAKTAALAQLSQADAAAKDQKAILALNTQLDAEINKQLQLQGGLTAEGAARLSMVATLKKQTSTTSLNTDAGIANRQAIEQAVAPIQAYRDSQIKAGVSTASATKTYENQGASLLQTIAKTDGANSATYKYAQQLLNVPKDVNTSIGVPGADSSIAKIKSLHDWGVKTNGNKVEIVSKIPLAGDVLAKIKRIDGAAVSANGTKVTVNSSMPNYAQVMAEIAAIEQQAVDRSFTITGYVRQSGHISDVGSVTGHGRYSGGYASGGRVGTESAPARLAAGGFPVRGPGSGLSDSIPAMLSNGEYVLNAATVSGAGGFDAIDRLVSVLNGGGAIGGGGSMTATLAASDSARLAAAFGQIAQILQRVQSMNVVMDGRTVGRAVAPHVANAITGSTAVVG